MVGRHQLGVTDLHGLLIEVAGTFILAAVCADGACEEGQRVLLSDKLQGRAVQLLAAQLHILGNVLLDGAAALAGSSEAVHPGHILLALALGQGLDGLDMVIVCVRSGGHLTNGLGAGAVKGLVGHGLHLFHHLQQAVVSTGLEDGGGHGDGPDTGGKELVAVEVFCAAGEGNAHLSLELAGNPMAHLNGQGEQAAAGHIHLVIGQLAPGGVHREGVGELQTKLQAVFIGQCLQALKHRHGVGPLEVFPEVVVVKHDIVIAHTVQNGPGGLVAQDGGVALHEGVQMLFGDEVGGNALDLIRGAAVEGGHGDAAGDTGRDGVNVVALLGEQLLEHCLALAENGGPGGVHHAVEVGVHLLALDALQVIAHGHIEHEAVGVAQAVDLGEDLQGAPGLNVFVHSLGHGQLRGPLLVVALVIGQDAGAGHAGGQVGAVHLLHGLYLKEAGPGEVGGDDVLSQLAVGTGGRPEGSLDAFAENGQALAAGLVGLVHAEDLAAHGVLGDHPVHKRLKRNGIHFFRHRASSYIYSK